ncbi:MAG: hypothetical protein DMG40_05000 [Acidobacteria bacterium]|nr:MAG: hypothetical protein DMG40_05000 [Acidobacteriota bacterium]
MLAKEQARWDRPNPVLIVTESLAHCARGCRTRQSEFLNIAVHDFGNVEKSSRAAVFTNKKGALPWCRNIAPLFKK